MIGRVSHSPQQLHRELLRTSEPVIFDVETTGLNVRSNRILSYGFRVRNDNSVTNFVIFTERCSTTDVLKWASSDAKIAAAFEALNRPSLILVGHNIKYDLQMLRREGYDFTGEVRDTQGMLMLLDQDRAYKGGAIGRMDLITPNPKRKWLDYKLKHVAAHLCGIKPVFTPHTNMSVVAYREHTTYLAHDLYATEQMYRHLWNQMTRRQKLPYRSVSVPVIHLLRGLNSIGVAADREFIQQEITHLSQLMERVNAAHIQRFGDSIDISKEELRDLIYNKYRLPSNARRNRKPSVGVPKLQKLLAETTDPRIAASLELIIGYLQLASSRKQLSDSNKSIVLSGRIHSWFDENKQVSGRISSTQPNLQQIAKPKTILPGTEFETDVNHRRMLVASPGFALVGADLDQADMRMLADAIANCKLSTSFAIMLWSHRRSMKHRHWLKKLPLLEQFINPNWTGTSPEALPLFDPDAPHQLVADFQNPAGDLYAQIASNITGKTIVKSDVERGIFKTVILAQVNGQSVKSLASDLNCSETQAKIYVDRFAASYPDVVGFLALAKQVFAINGQVRTWTGRTRTVTGHRWMVDQPRVRLLLTYKSGNHYWFDVSPIEPRLRNLTCFIHRVWSIKDSKGFKSPKLIYDSSRGRIGTKRYVELDKKDLYLLPIRNLPWSNIRCVQRLENLEPVEEVNYDGFDKTTRSAINTIMQGGTSDLTTNIALRCDQFVRSIGGRLLLMIHDELIWEVPTNANTAEFRNQLKAAMESPPTATFGVPVTVEMKHGPTFGTMQK